MIRDIDGVENLEVLIAEAFTRHELLAFALGLEGGKKLVLELPDPPASRRELSAALVAICFRYNLVEHEFFSRLKSLRPGRLFDIEEIESAVLGRQRPAQYLNPGVRLGADRYRLEELIGCGGFGTLWKAYDKRRLGHVAIKVLDRNTRDNDYALRRTMFMRGTRRMALIRDPYIAEIYEAYVSESGYDYCVLEYVRGVSISEAMRSRRLTDIGALAHILLEIGYALAQVHDAGLVHGDVSPRNILVDEKDHPKLIDFDLVSAIEGDLLTKVATQRPSTDPFSAPEWKAGGREIDGRVDVFGLGMTLIYLVYGDTPPKSMNEVHADYDSDGFIEHKLRCSGELKRVLKKACALDPRRRYVDMRSFCADLQRALDLSPSISPSSSTASGHDLTGTVLNDCYRIEEQIHRGESGTVYLARHLTLPRKYAIKVLSIGRSGRAQHSNLFMEEAKACSRIVHPHIVGVSDFGECPSGRPFMVSEYVPGKSLDQALKEGGAPMPWNRARKIILQICAALDAIHECGAVHGSLEPRHVILTRVGTDLDFVKLLGVGAASAFGQPKLRSVKYSIVDKNPEYASPEHIAGLPLDPRSDVYSTGVILFELLVGNTPFSGDSVIEVVNRHLFETPQIDVSTAPTGIRAVIERAMSKDPAARYQTVSEIRLAIDALPTEDSQGPVLPATVGADVPPAPAHPSAASMSSAPTPAQQLQGSRSWLLVSSILLSCVVMVFSLCRP